MASLEVEQISAVVSEAGQRITEFAQETTDALENDDLDHSNFVTVPLSKFSMMLFS